LTGWNGYFFGTIKIDSLFSSNGRIIQLCGTLLMIVILPLCGFRIQADFQKRQNSLSSCISIYRQNGFSQLPTSVTLVDDDKFSVNTSAPFADWLETNPLSNNNSPSQSDDRLVKNGNAALVVVRMNSK